MEVAHHSDINFHLSYSDLIKCQENFRFEVRSNDTFALQLYIKFIKFAIPFPTALGKMPYVCLYHEIRCPHAILPNFWLTVSLQRNTLKDFLNAVVLE